MFEHFLSSGIESDLKGATVIIEVLVATGRMMSFVSWSSLNGNV